MKRTVQSLNGWWSYSVNGVAQPPVRVPFSAHCVGDSVCRTRFSAPQAPCVKLCFEGIAYRAQVTLNGKPLGTMGPYSRCEFDVTDCLLPQDNLLEVSLQDMNLPFGPSEGWENYGGIIRDVYLTGMERTHIADVVWRTETQPPYREALCRVQVTVEGEQTCDVSASLFDPNGEQTAAVQGVTRDGLADLCFSLRSPRLWSPDAPQLYRLVVRAGADETEQWVGVKDFRIQGRRFFLNGEPIFLRGVNRHDMWGDQGYTLTEEQMERDLRMIKATGSNYVRLVHYPHHPRIAELADRIGLLISEEPGLWWSDLNNPEVVEGALDAMRRVVLRDRNRVSVAFWLCFNECVFTPEFIAASSGLCRSLDPTRPVSGANAMDLEMTKKLYRANGFDFYTRHPYTYDIHQFRKEAAYLNDMPLVFTEWGGYFVFENGALFEDSLREMLACWREQDDGAVLAGCSYWCWADMYEFGRGGLACGEGILHEGLVDIHRNPRGNLERLTRFFHAIDLPQAQDSHMEVLLDRAPAADYRPLDLWRTVDEAEQQAAFQSMIEASTPQAGFVHKKNRCLTHGPVLPSCVPELNGLPVSFASGKPLVIEGGKRLSVPVGRFVKALHVVGNVCMPWGYPVYGKKGEEGARYVLHYEDGSVLEIPLRNGLELTTALGQQGPSRIRPVAPNVRPALRWSYDENWEHYVANLYDVQVDGVLREVEIVSCMAQCTLLVFAVTAEE